MFWREKMSRRICSLFLAFILTLTLLPATVFAASSTSGKCGRTATWSFDSATGTLTIAGSGRTDDYDHEWTIGGEIVAPWEAFRDQIRKVNIGANITYVGEEAFSGGGYNSCAYPSLATITFESKSRVTEIGNYAFAEANAVESITLPASLEKIGYESLPVRALETVYVESGNKTFYTDNGVLYQEKKLLIYPACKEDSSYAILNGTEEIAAGAISGDVYWSNSFLTSIWIPSSVEKIPNTMFLFCENLSQINLAEGIKEIDSSAFWLCPALKRVEIPASVTRFTAEVGAADAWHSGDDGLLDIYFRGSSAPEFDAAVCETRSSSGKVIVYYPVSASGWDTVQAQEDVKAAVAEGTLEFKTWEATDADRNALRLTASTPANGATISADELVLTFSKDISWNPNWLNGSIYIKDYYTDATIITLDDRGFYSHNGHISGNQLVVPLAFTELPIGRYYVEIDANVIAAANADESGVISLFKGTQKGELVFYQKSAYVTMKVDDGVNSNVNISWDDQWFDNPSSTYMHDLAIASMALSGASYVENSKGTPSSDAVKKALTGLGFDSDTLKSCNYDYPLSEDDNDVVSYTFARKKVHINTGTYDLIAVVVKGTSGNEEWYSNFNIGINKTHRGFTLAKDGLMKSLRDYISDLGIQGTSTKILVTGHSRGAAVANLVAAELCDASYAAKANVYAYTFATPAVTTDSRRSEGHYNNIFNIVSGEDFVTQVPLKKWNYGRYGIDLLLPSRSYYGSGYTRVFNKMSSKYSALVGKEFEAYPNGTQAVRNVCDNVYKLAPTVTKYYTEYYFAGNGYLGIFLSPCDYFHEIARVVIYGDTDHILSITADSLSRYLPVTLFFVNNHMIHGRIFAAHGMASYYSWLTTCTPEELFGSTNKESAKWFKALTVACPVDVYVYDEAGDLVASVVNDIVVEGELAVSVEDGAKLIDIPSDQNYSVKIVATDSGEMDYTVQEYIATASGDDLQRTVEFHDLQLSDGQAFSGKINNISGTAKENYALTTEDEVIYPDYDSNDAQQPSHSGSNSGTSSPSYAVSVSSKVENGTVTVSPRSAEKGDTVTITVKPNSGYQLDNLIATDKDGNKLNLINKGSGKYTFTMPASKVEINATFIKAVEVSPFADVATNAYYYEAVKWAVGKGITTGVGNNLFAPEQPCTRAQIVTFLWRAAGSPEPKGAAVGMTDVVSGSYYEKAVAWAIENGVTTGTTITTFSPDATCTRAQAVTFLTRALNAKAESKAEFSDVPTDSYFAEAVAWAAANGVTDGVGNGLFAPDNDCTRGQIVTFLYRSYNK